MEYTKIKFMVNGFDHEILVRNNWSLAKVLRDELGLMGTKVGCGEGECGACTVFMNGRTVTSCLVLAPQADGAEILTIEGLCGKDGKLHPIQEAYVEAGAIQCGFCTPGFIMSTLALLNKYPDPTDDQIKKELAGNLCRCTGYQKIFEAVRLASKKLKEGSTCQ